MRVVIDGVRYAPVSEANLDVLMLQNALVEEWWGKGTLEEKC